MEQFELRIIELIGYLKGLDYTKDDLYLQNMIHELRDYINSQNKASRNNRNI